MQAGNVSIVYLLELNGKSLLFTGDIEPNVADRIADELKPHLDGKRVNVFLMTHHGANSSSDARTRQAHQALVGRDLRRQGNQAHHPQKTAVNRLKAIDGTTIWCTPTNGTVTAKISSSGILPGLRAGRKPRGGRARRVQHGKCNEF